MRLARDEEPAATAVGFDVSARKYYGSFSGKFDLVRQNCRNSNRSTGFDNKFLIFSMTMTMALAISSSVTVTISSTY